MKKPKHKAEFEWRQSELPDGNAARRKQLHTDEMRRPAGGGGCESSSVGGFRGVGGKWEVALGCRLKKPFCLFLVGKKSTLAATAALSASIICRHSSANALLRPWNGLKGFRP